MELELSTACTNQGLQLITLENRFLHLQVLSQAGGKIWQMTYKPLAADLLWNNPQIAPAQHPIRTNYDDVWSGGWDELFPVDEESKILGELYPDHGELWTGQWDAEAFSSQEEIGVVLRCQTPISRFTVEKKLSLRLDRSIVYVHYRFTNHGDKSFPFLWKLHPAFKATPQHRIDFPTMQVVREPIFPGTLQGAPLQFAWPIAKMPSGDVDLRRVSKPEERQLYFFYGTEMQGGWCAITDTARGLCCGLKFDPAIFPSCWLFASYGGWRNLNVAVLEPSTGFPFQFDSLMAAGRQKVLKPGESFATEVLFTVQPNIYSVAAVHDDGTIAEAK